MELVSVFKLLCRCHLHLIKYEIASNTLEANRAENCFSQLFSNIFMSLKFDRNKFYSRKYLSFAATHLNVQ